MSPNRQLTTPQTLPTAIAEETRERVRAILDEGTAANTREAYRKDVVYFWAWAREALGLEETYPAPSPAIVKFITDHLTGLDAAVDRALVHSGVKDRLGPHKVSTVSRRISVLSAAHRAHGFEKENPCRSYEVRTLLSRARKAAAKQGKGVTKKTAAPLDVLNDMLKTCKGLLIDQRDRAVLLFAFSSGGRRRSEVAAARFEDLTPVESGYLYRVPHSKTDQEGEGFTVPVVGRAGCALIAWLEASGIQSGPLFRGITKTGQLRTGGISDRTVARIVKKRAAMAGYDPDDFGAHSLRSGFITETGRQGVALGDAMALSGHRTIAVAMGYYQPGAVLNNPAARIAG